MEVVLANDGLLTNFEVLKLLEQKGHKKKAGLVATEVG